MFFDPQDPEVLDFDALGFDELGRSPLSAAGHVYERFDDPEAELVKQPYMQGRAKPDEGQSSEANVDRCSDTFSGSRLDF